MTKKEYESLKERNRVITKEERQAAAEAAEKEKERLIRESMERTEAMRQMNLEKCRDKDPKTKEIEEEARKRRMHILDRAENMRLEQEENIQKCNRLILETKCRAIRDAQVNVDRSILNFIISIRFCKVLDKWLVNRLKVKIKTKIKTWKD